MKRLFVVLAVLVLASASSCAHHAGARWPPAAITHNPGAITQAERIGGHRAATLRALLWWADLPEHVSVRTGVDLYRVEYETTGYDGKVAVASGLVAFPKRGTLKGVVSYQHGTRTCRENSPSAPSPDEGLLGAAVFAGGGYLFVAPDFIGLGTNHDVHPYLHAESAASTTIDLLRAAEALCAEKHRPWPGAIYLTGFSQGGFSTAAAQRALEKLDDKQLHVVASAPISAACDLAGIGFPYAMQQKSTLYLAYISNAYSAIYKKDLTSLVRAPFDTQLPQLFDGEHDEDAVSQVLPKDPREMFTPEFLAAYDAGRPTWLLEKLAANEVFAWAPKAPTRFYYGTKDTDVSPAEAPAAATEMARRGGNATAVCTGEFNHIETAMHAIPAVRRWFDEVSGSDSR